jgi:hypothetical protein
MGRDLRIQVLAQTRQEHRQRLVLCDIRWEAKNKCVTISERRPKGLCTNVNKFVVKEQRTVLLGQVWA